MNKKRFSKKLWIFVGCSFILIIVVTMWTVFLNYRMNEVIYSRVRSLDYYEVMKFSVRDEIYRYLSVRDESSYESAKRESIMTDDLMKRVYGGVYNELQFLKPQDFEFVDIQYTLTDRDDVFKVYLLVNVDVDGQTKGLRFLAFLKDERIYDLFVF